MKLEHIYKSYGDKKVLEDFSIAITEGKCTVIMGESGCGKTTLLRIIMGLEEPSVTLNTEKISAVFQENRLCENFTAVENVAMVMKGKKAKDSEKQIRATFERLKLQEDSLKQPVSELSGGMQRRVAIARALLADAELIVMDEPFDGLDEDTKQSVMEYVKEATLGKTVILVTHDSYEAEYMGDVICNM